MMFIKFDELDMLDFFESKPIFIGEEGEGRYIYSIKDTYQFTMTVVLDVYTQQIDISVVYDDKTVLQDDLMM